MARFSKEDLQSETIEAAIQGHHTCIKALPRIGANLISFRVDGREFLNYDPGRMLTGEPHSTGCFHMFPTPCRLHQARYRFENREITQRKRGEEIDLHGLIRDEPFEVSSSGHTLTATLDIEPGHPVYEGHPFSGRLTIQYLLIARGMEIRFCYENRGDMNAPVGYGVHPFWQIPADRADMLVKVPGESRLEFNNPKDLLPTGKLIPVVGTHYDLREFRSLADLFIDDVYYPIAPRHGAALAFPQEGIELRIEASENMKHMICYSPEGEDCVCLENLTCAPDAPNLYQKGYPNVSGLIVVAPGERVEAWVRYRVEEAHMPI